MISGQNYTLFLFNHPGEKHKKMTFFTSNLLPYNRWRLFILDIKINLLNSIKGSFFVGICVIPNN